MQRLNHKKIIKIRSFLLLILIGFIQSSFAQQNSPGDGTLNGKIICIDPGHGGSAATDSYRQGPTGE
ncbi:MAG: hypothetical protein Q7U83_16925, partial [Daejeonella sp.]|nr:hypothetical protein [Daejeonella sp.]